MTNPRPVRLSLPEPDPKARDAGGDLAGRVAVITGGSRGIGLAIAHALARNGAQTVIASRKIESCRQVAKDLERTYGPRSLGTSFHAASWEQCDELFRLVQDEFDSADILINNAGMSPHYPSIDAISEELFDKVIGVNLKGPFRLSALFATSMASGEGGSIVNISSVSAIQPRSGEVVYGAAKAALDTLTTAFARAFGPSVRVNTVMPGPIATEVVEAWDKEELARLVDEEIPLRRLGLPDEVAAAVLYLVGDTASYTSGAVLKIDGAHSWASS